MAYLTIRGGGWTLDERGWTLDEENQERVRVQLIATMQAIDESHAHLPRCKLCGQRVRKLDAWGLCSKTSEPHLEARARRGER